MHIPEEVQGKSLYGILNGNSSTENHKESVLCEFNDCLAPATINNEYAGTHGLMCFDGQYKICVYDTANLGELYDLKNDPNEFSDLWDSEDHKGIKLQMQEKLIFKYMSTSSKGPRRVAEY